MIERIGTADRSACCRDVPGTRSVFAERVGGGYFLDFDLKREQLARYGLSVDDAQMVVMNAIGGDNVGTTVEGRERYPDQRALLPRFRAATWIAWAARWCRPWTARCRSRWPRSRHLKLATGPSMLRNENGMLNGYVYVDVAGRDVGSYVAEAKQRGARADVASARRLYAGLERPVRSHGARARAPEIRAAADAVPHLHAALPEYEVHCQDADRSCWPCRSRPWAPSGCSTCWATT